MLGVKINEFDNSDGKRETFNKIFPDTTLLNNNVHYVEIGGIVDKINDFNMSPYVRELLVFNEDFKQIGRFDHDFGRNNFINSDLIQMGEGFQYRYVAKDLDDKLLATAFTCKDLAEKLNCNVMVIKRRLMKKCTINSPTVHLFNVTRKGL